MNTINKRPEVVVFAGPNGSGKSTITHRHVDGPEPQAHSECK